jgi:hypothetical protein
MPAGKANLYVRIIDDLGGVTTFYLSNTVNLTMNQTFMSDVITSLMRNDSTNQVVGHLQQGNLVQTTQIVTSLASFLSNVSASSLDQRVAVRDILVSSLNSLDLTDISSLKLVASSMSSVTNKVEENSLTSSVGLFIFLNRSNCQNMLLIFVVRM